MGNQNKAGMFNGFMGFDKAALGPSLRNQLVDNFGSASSSVPMLNGEDAQIGMKFTVAGPITGPSGATWDIISAWRVNWNGTVHLITTTP
jgi:hypothetical protein